MMDGHYVPNITFGFDLIPALKKRTSLPLVPHLELDNPDDLIDPLARLGIDDLRDKEIGDLSPGEQRLVDFAALLLLTPRVYLLDAPFQGAGERDANRYARCLRTEVARGSGVVITALRREELGQLTDQVLLLKDGRLQELPDGGGEDKVGN